MKEEESSDHKKQEEKAPELEKTLMYNSGDKLQGAEDQKEAAQEQGAAAHAEAPEDVPIGRTISDPGSDTGSLNPELSRGNTPTQSDDSALPGHVFAGRFSVEALLGEGGMGRVYLASDRQVNGRKVALKVLLADLSEDPRFRSLFFQEIDAATSFVSEHVVQVRDTGQLDDGMLFLTMDYIEGEALDTVMLREGTFATRHALEVVRQILLGLGSGHAKGYVHRDLKPGNVMLAARTPKTDGNPHGVNARILDFGISGIAAELDHKKLMGTPAYMSPEQHLGEAIDLRSDLFSVGVILYELLTGERPFQGKTLKELTTSVLESDIAASLEQYEQIPKSVRGFLQKALAKNRDQRFQNATEFIQAIERSGAYKAKSKSPALINVIAIVAVLAALGEGAFLVSSEFRGVKAANLELQTKNRVDDAVVAARKETAAELERKFELDRQELLTTAAALREDSKRQGIRISALELELTERKEELRAAGERAREQSEKILERDDAIELARKRDVAAQSDIAVLTTENNGLKSDLLAFRYESKEEVKAARVFDDVAAFLGSGRYGMASQTLRTALTSSESMLQPGIGDSIERGGGILKEIVDGFLAIDEFVSDGESDSALLSDARRSLDSAKKNVSSFSTVAGSWIGYALDKDKSEDVPDRQSIAEGLVGLLEQELQSAQSGLESRHDEKRRMLFENPLTSDPGEIIEHSIVYECDDAKTVLDKFAAELQRQLVQEDGTLDRPSLEAFPNLEQWGQQLKRDPAELPWLDPDTKAEVIEFARARMWYIEGKELDYPVPLSWSESQSGSWNGEQSGAGPAPAWHQLLAMQQELFDSRENKCPFLRVDQAFYRIPGGPGQNVWWLLSRRGDLPESGRIREWGIDRTVVGSSSGSKPNDLSMSGTQIRQAGKVLCDLASLEGVELADWSGPKVNFDEIQSNPGLPTTKELQRFAQSVEEQPLPCLVLRSNGKTYWISPELGLVLRERDGKTLQELIYFDRR